MAPSSFGLRPENKTYILEEIFNLVQYCRVSWSEAWRMPIAYRKWMIARVDSENKKLEEKRKELARSKKGRPPPT